MKTSSVEVAAQCGRTHDFAWGHHYALRFGVKPFDGNTGERYARLGHLAGYGPSDGRGLERERQTPPVGSRQRGPSAVTGQAATWSHMSWWNSTTLLGDLMAKSLARVNTIGGEKRSKDHI